MRLKWLGGIGLIGLLGCTGETVPLEVEADGPALSIEDAVHNGGNEHFFWLPPMVSNPAYDGTFDPLRMPVVEICEWTGTACALPLVAEFSMTSGTNGELVTVDTDHYHVNWNTNEFNLDDTKTYRIVVRIDGQELGHADVDVVDNGNQLKNVDTNEFIPLKDGRTLPIKFRIEEGLVLDDEGPTTLAVAADPNPATVGQALDLTATVDDAATGGSAIASAEYNVDGGSYTAMAAADGTFDGVSEAVEATIPAFAATGDYTVCVRGTDAGGNVGADACITVTVAEFAWAALGVGWQTSCAITTTGSGYCWGRQIQGEGGTGHPNRANLFAQPILGDSVRDLVSIDLGSANHCALSDTGEGWCSGVNSWNVLGTTVPLPIPGENCGGECSFNPLIVEGGLTFTELHLKDTHACGLTAAGTAYCWGTFQAQFLGTGDDGSLGVCDFGPANCSPTPIPVEGGHTFTTMTVGATSCGLTAPGDPLGNVWCWGENKWGPVGNGTNDNRYYSPVRGANGLTLTHIDGGSNSTCGLDPAGVAYCWGYNLLGAVGIGDSTAPADCAPSPTQFTACATTPVPVNMPAGVTFTQISVAEELDGSHVCAVANTQDAYCWGFNDKGQVGDGATTAQHDEPSLVVGGHKFLEVSTGGGHSCGITVGREIYCWGSNSHGQLGVLPADALAHPTPIRITDPT